MSLLGSEVTCLIFCNLVELIMAFEDKFGAEISDDDAQKITTVGEAVKYIDARKK